MNSQKMIVDTSIDRRSSISPLTQLDLISIHYENFALTTLLLVFATCCSAQTTFPGWFHHSFKGKQLNKKFSITPFLKNGFLQADFNGDRLVDIAVLVTEKITGKKGILLLHLQGSY